MTQDPALVRISITDLPADDLAVDQLRMLDHWLQDEPGLLGASISLPVGAPRPGRLGPVSDVLVVALGGSGAGAGTVLAQSLIAWIRSRQTQLTVRITTAAGQVEVRTSTSADPVALIEQVAKILPPDVPA